jgi:ATP-dependent protease ClpP protease subunit
MSDSLKIVEPKERLILEGAVDEDMCGELLAYLVERKGKAAYVYLNTGGGDVYQAREMCDLIKQHGNVTVHVFGVCMSAGIYILCAAARRIATPARVLMVHFGMELNTSDDDVKRHRKITAEIKELLKQRVNVPAKTLSQWFKQDSYFDAESAKTVGLVTEVAPCL